MTIWEAMDLVYKPGYGRVITAMGDALAAAENGAHATFNEDRDKK